MFKANRFFSLMTVVAIMLNTVVGEVVSVAASNTAHNSGQVMDLSIIINEDCFVYDPDFLYKSQIQDFLKGNSHPLIAYKDVGDDGYETLASDLILRASMNADYSISPKVFLTIIEMRREELAQSSQNGWTNPLGVNQPGTLSSQLQWMGNVMWDSYVSFAKGKRDIELLDGSSIIISDSNAGAFAISTLLAQMYSRPDWEFQIDRFVETYQRLFNKNLQALRGAAAPQVVVDPFLLKPFHDPDNDFIKVNSFMDHRYPLRTSVPGGGCPIVTDPDNAVTRPDGTVADNGTCQNCTLGYSCYDAHVAIDYGVSTIQSVYAAATGTVQSVTDGGTAGWTVILQHGDGFQTLYLHLSNVSKRVKDAEGNPSVTISRGEEIATGTKSGKNHLHFAVRRNGRDIDPFGWWSQEDDPWAEHAQGAASQWLWDNDDDNLVVDNRDNAAQLFGINYWNRDSEGFQGESWYTGSTTNRYAPKNWAIWGTSISQPGWYRVYAYWKQHADNTTSAEYQVFHQGVATTVTVNQRDQGDGWILLGYYEFDAEPAAVILTDQTDDDNKRVYVDAVKWVAGSLATGSCNHPDIPFGVGVGAVGQDGKSAEYVRNRICDAYLRNKEHLGDPRDNGGGVNAHQWGDYQVQDFASKNSDLGAIIVYNPFVGAAFVVRDGIWDRYAEIGGVENNDLKGPVSDEMAAPDYYRGFADRISYFESGYLTWQADSALGPHQYDETDKVYFFRDVPPNHKFYPNVKGIYEATMTSGCARNQDGYNLFYCPETPIPLPQLAMMLGRQLYQFKDPMLDLPPAPDGVTDDGWNRVINALAKDGILDENALGNLYDPNRLLTRAETVDIIVRAVLSPRSVDDYIEYLRRTNKPLGGHNIDYYLVHYPFGDVDYKTPHHKSLVLGWWLGIAGGYTGGTFRPGETATRAHAAAFLCRAFLEACDNPSNLHLEELHTLRQLAFMAPGIKTVTDSGTYMALVNLENPDVTLKLLYDFAGGDKFERKTIHGLIDSNESAYIRVGDEYHPFATINGGGFTCDGFSAGSILGINGQSYSDNGDLVGNLRASFFSYPKATVHRVGEYPVPHSTKVYSDAANNPDGALTYILNEIANSEFAVGYERTFLDQGKFVPNTQEPEEDKKEDYSTAIGISKSGGYVFLATSGVVCSPSPMADPMAEPGDLLTDTRWECSKQTIEEFAGDLVEAGAYRAILLDSGESSQFLALGIDGSIDNDVKEEDDVGFGLGVQCGAELGKPRPIINSIVAYNKAINYHTDATISEAGGKVKVVHNAEFTFRRLIRRSSQSGYNALSAADYSTVTIRYTPQPITPTDHLANTGIFYRLSAAFADGTPAIPAESYSVTITYDQDNVRADKTNESDLALYSWNGTTWVREPTSVVDVEANTVTAHPSQFGYWAILAPDISNPHTYIVPGAQGDPIADYVIIIRAMQNGEQPLMATQAFTITDANGSIVYPAGTVIIPGRLEGNVGRIHTGPQATPPSVVLRPQEIGIYESDSPDERASWEVPDHRKALETRLGLHEWPFMNEITLTLPLDTMPVDIVFVPAGVTPDMLDLFVQANAADILPTQAQAGRWFVFQADACRLAEQGSLVPAGTVIPNALPAGEAALVAVQPDEILTYNWPAGMAITRYNDTPRLNVTGDLVRVANYTDNNEAAIVLRRIGSGGVILIGGHASHKEETYGLLYHALFTASAEKVESQVSVAASPASRLLPRNVVQGGEAGADALVNTTITNVSQETVNSFKYTEIISGFTLASTPFVAIGTVTVTVLPTGTVVVWNVDSLPPGEYRLPMNVATASTDTLKEGRIIISQASFSYTESLSNQTIRNVHLPRPDATIEARLPALLVANFTEEPDNFYPFPAEGRYIHVRGDLDNKPETRADDVVYVTTVPFLVPLQDADNQYVFPSIQGTQENVWMSNVFMGYPDRNYPLPVGAVSRNWRRSMDTWDGETWVSIPVSNPLAISIPPEYAGLITPDADNQAILVPGATLAFELGTLLAYDRREPAVRYMIHSRELLGRGISFSSYPVSGTLVVEGRGGVVYTGVGQNPVPFHQILSKTEINNLSAPTPSQITYTDAWGRLHTITDAIRSSFYGIVPYPGWDGSLPEVQLASVYEITGKDGAPLADIATGQVVTLTITIKAESTDRDLSADQMILQEMLPRGLGYDIELVTWESSDDSFHLLDEYTVHLPAFELLHFQGDLPANQPQTIRITARLRTYPAHPREGMFLVDGGAQIAAPAEWGAPGQFDTHGTWVRVEQGYQASTQVEKWLRPVPEISRQGGDIYEITRVSGAADVQRYMEEVYMNSTGGGDKAAVVRVGGSRGANLYFATVKPGGKTMIVVEITNISGVDWHNPYLTYNAPPGISLSPILTDGLEAPSNVYDTPYLWATEIPDISRGVYYYEVHVDESVAPGVMYPITFRLTGENVPSESEFTLPAAMVGVGDDVRHIQGQASDIQIIDYPGAYVEPSVAKWIPSSQCADAMAITRTEDMAAFFAPLTSDVSFVTRSTPDGYQVIYTIPTGLQTLPAQDGSEILEGWCLLVKSHVGALAPGSHLVSYGPQIKYVDDSGAPQTATGNPTHVFAMGPALTGRYTQPRVTSLFYNNRPVEPAPGEEIDACVGVDAQNTGNHVAVTPVISVTANSALDAEIVGITPTPLSVADNVITWQIFGLVPGETTQMNVCLRFTPPAGQEMSFSVPLLVGAHAQYVGEWGKIPYTITSQLGGEYGLRVYGDLPPAPDLYSAAWRDNQTVALAWRGAPGVQDYQVYRSTKPDRDFSPVGAVVNGTEHVDIVWDNPPAPVYYYTVRARNAGQVEGFHSQVLSVYTEQRAFQVYLPMIIKAEW